MAEESGAHGIAAKGGERPMVGSRSRPVHSVDDAPVVRAAPKAARGAQRSSFGVRSAQKGLMATACVAYLVLGASGAAAAAATLRTDIHRHTAGAAAGRAAPRVQLARQMLDETVDGGEEGVKTASKTARLDPSNFLVVIIATAILIYCCHRTLRPPFLNVEKMSTSERQEMRELEEAGELELHSAFLFVVVASAALLLIFYFMSAMSLLITVLFSFIATISLGATLYPYVDHLTGNRFSHDTEVPLLGPTPTLVFVLAPVCIFTVALWLITKSWILNNILAISLIVLFLTTIRISSLMVNTVLLVLAFFYDIFWVFCSSAVFGSNVMVTVATQLDVPIKILVPLILTEEGSDLQFTLIGLGDIVLPGLLLSFAMRFDDNRKVDLRSGYFAVTMTGYVVGLMICEVIVGAFHLAQPAMIYLVPGTLIPFYAMAMYRGELGEAWAGLKGSNYIDIVEERP